MDADAYRAAFRGSAMKRAKLPAMQRNAAVVLGNPSLRSEEAALAEDLAVLTRALDDAEPLVQEHAAWALRRIAERQRAAAAASPTRSRNASTGSNVRR